MSISIAGPIVQCFIFTCFQLVLKSIQIQKVGVDSLRFHFNNTDSEKSLLRKDIQVVQKYSPFKMIFMCVGVQLTIKIREYEYCRLDLAVEQQVGEWGNAGGEVETAFAAKLPGSNHYKMTSTKTVLISK